MTGTTRSLLTAAGIGALAGMRSLAAPALLSRAWSEARPPAARRGAARVVAAPATSRVLRLLSVAEMVVDKAPWTPARIEPVPLAGRALLGALCGALVAGGSGRVVAAAAMVGGTTAIAVAGALYTLRRLARRSSPFPDAALGLAEDGLVFALGAGLRSTLR